MGIEMYGWQTGTFGVFLCLPKAQWKMRTCSIYQVLMPIGLLVCLAPKYSWFWIVLYRIEGCCYSHTLPDAYWILVCVVCSHVGVLEFLPGGSGRPQSMSLCGFIIM